MNINANKVKFTSVTRSDLVTELYRSKELQFTIQNLCFTSNQNNLKDDVTQELYLVFLEMKDEKLCKLINTNSIYFFCITFLKLSLTSKYSPFFYKFKKHKTIEMDEQKAKEYHNHNSDLDQNDSFFDLLPDNPDRRCIEDIEIKVEPELTQFINGLHWYDRLIFQYYWQEFNSLSKLNKHTDIPKSELQRVLSTTKKSILEFIERKQLLT